MKRNIVVVIILILLLQVGKGLIINRFIEQNGNGRIEFTATNNGIASYDEIKRSNDYDTFLPVLLKKEKIFLDQYKEPVVVVGTTPAYAQLEKLIMLDGSFFINSAVEEARNTIVISDQVAQEIFRATDVVGKTIECSGQTFKIVGVYKKYRNLYDHAVDYGYDIVYIPITASMLEEVPISQIIFNETAINDKLSEMTLTQMGISSESAIKSDYIHWIENMKTISIYPLLLMFVIGSMITIKKMKAYIDEHHIWQVLKAHEEWQLIFKVIGVGIGLMGVSVLMIVYLYSNLYISPKRLPNENIFDIAFYWKQCLEDWKNSNLYMMESISRFGKRIEVLRNILADINLVEYVLIIGLGIKLVLNRKKIESKERGKA